MSRPGGKPPEEAAYGLGLKHGRTPRHPFAPRSDWSGEEHRAYARGFDMGVDLLIDEREAA